jgi:hypothetical protein
LKKASKSWDDLATLDDQWSSHLLLQVILAAAAAPSEQVMPTSQHHRQSCYSRHWNKFITKFKRK